MAEALATWAVRWTNFRGYEAGPKLDFPAITLFIGRNNVGKTSAYAPLLLLRQTLFAKSPETALLLRGEQMDFGTYQDIVTDHDTSREIRFHLNFGPLPNSPTFNPPDSSSLLEPRSIEIQFGHSDNYPARLTRSMILDKDDRALVTRSLQTDGRFRVSSPLLPSRNQIGRPTREVSQLRRQMQSEVPSGFEFSGVSGLRIPALWRQDRERWSKVQGWYAAANELYEIYFYVNRLVDQTLTNIAYIGPLRSSPQRSYSVSAEPPRDVGRDGEYATEVLYQSYRAATTDVLDRTNLWLRRLGYGELLFRAHGDYFQVFLRKPDEEIEINIADCGMGLSQLLPLVVQGSAMDVGDTLIAQQPEIHLNPAQQDIMTDFLLSLAHSGRRVIVETHSEHVLGRLRRRVAEGETVDSDDVAIYFCESFRQRSSVRRIPMGHLANIDPDDWPEGFFNEQLANSIELALAQSRRKRLK